MSVSSHVTVKEAGRRGAAARWAGHIPKVIRLSSLTREQRGSVLRFIEEPAESREIGADFVNRIGFLGEFKKRRGIASWNA